MRIFSHNPARTPIIDAIQRFKGIDKAPFHIPGHKRGAFCPEQLTKIISSDVLNNDLTELPGLDYLSDPTDAIAASQSLAADTFGADRTWFLVNGTSVGLQAAIMAACRPGDHVLVARNCHVSVFNGLITSGCKPLWILPEIDRGSNVAVGVTVAALRSGFHKARLRGLAPKAVVVVSPSYFGSCSDVSGLANLCHEYKVPLIVDEAHGSHFGMDPSFPKSAMQQGADVAVQSSHKTMASLGQSSMLHLQGQLVDPLRISQSLNLLHTTSPSYLLLASLDACQAFAYDWKREEIKVLPMDSVFRARAALKQLPGVSLLEDSCASAAGESAVTCDPWRITINVTLLGQSGFQVEQQLQADYDIYPELATQQVVVFALGPGTLEAHLDALVESLSDICSRLEVRCEEIPTSSQVPLHLPDMMLTPREAFFAETEQVSADKAIGRISSETLCPYPPGIPVAFPGEVLDEGVINQLQQVLQAGGKVTGARDGTLNTITVIKH